MFSNILPKKLSGKYSLESYTKWCYIDCVRPLQTMSYYGNK